LEESLAPISIDNYIRSFIGWTKFKGVTRLGKRETDQGKVNGSDSQNKRKKELN
jgi:hypothetical protein